ncbi:thiamine biosynthesis protein ThiC [Pseudochelatococcus lubricantis]|uniref:Thiamine biosynthesis protein ThiC n=1 Tax=Pseudochelatococcus lubricantis TaxID=1538102 RepID=A0ABX0UZA3_9HYPH|nr:hypothetical protein [Pseudochelatococcus lubricantis]NIJ57189.1 thiamine biosynthesis protein ThiC [Pseudochelatococcus lubricantis]
MRKFVTIALCGALTACASKSSDIRASYVSPIQYQSYTCQQLAEEASRVSARASEVAGTQDSARSNDAAMTAVAVVIFWPALFALKGDKQTAAELGRLKGELDAIEQASIRKNCNIKFQKAPPAT